MTAFTILALLAGLVCLVAGAELLVRGAAAIAAQLGVAPVIVGLTVVAVGTSAPELAVSVSAGVGGNGDIALGNVLGSNIGNILLILGASAVIGGLAVSNRLVRLDLPLLVVVSVGVLLLGLDGEIGRIDGAVLAIGFVAYTAWLVRAARRDRAGTVAPDADDGGDGGDGGDADDADAGAATDGRRVGPHVALVLAGLVVLVVGSQLLVGSAGDIATALGVSELVIGLTVVAVGTSLPELATSILAAIRGQRDIAVGNIVGSNLFNLLGVLGLTGIVAGDGVAVGTGSLRLDLPVMIAATLVLLPVFWSGFEVSRREGIVLVAFYFVYVGYLVLDVGDHAAADVVGPAALIVGGLVALTLAVTGVQGWRRHRLDPEPEGRGRAGGSPGSVPTSHSAVPAEATDRIDQPSRER